MAKGHRGQRRMRVTLSRAQHTRQRTWQMGNNALEQPSDQGDRHQFVRQYSLAQILGVWAAAAVPMGVLAWIVAPWLRDQLGGEDPFAEALLICLTAGLIWQFVLVLILTRRELGGSQWSRVREALWLLPPRTRRAPVWVEGSGGGCSPSSSSSPSKPLISIPGPSVRDFADFLDSDRGEDFFSGSWGWFAVVVVLVVFNTVLGEELLFRGLLLPRMKNAFGKWDWAGNGALSAVYHLHQPWVIPDLPAGHLRPRLSLAVVQSAWMGIIVHLAPERHRHHRRPHLGARLSNKLTDRHSTERLLFHAAAHHSRHLDFVLPRGTPLGAPHGHAWDRRFSYLGTTFPLVGAHPDLEPVTFLPALPGEDALSAVDKSPLIRRFNLFRAVAAGVPWTCFASELDPSDIRSRCS